jgi:glutaredoxin-related protein
MGFEELQALSLNDQSEFCGAGVPFAARNILEDQELRQAMKSYRYGLVVT